jgi:hypothetical protein
MVVGLVPGSYFEVLGVRPILGRVFTPAEREYGHHYVAAIGDRFWRTRFAADPRVLGRTLRINGETYSIVAVVPDVIPAWMDQVTAPISIWTPFAFPDLWSEDGRGGRGYLSLGRLKPDVSYDRARTELATLAARLASDHPVDRGIGATSGLAGSAQRVAEMRVPHRWCSCDAPPSSPKRQAIARSPASRSRNFCRSAISASVSRAS